MNIRQEEIATSVDMTQQAVAVWEDEFAKKSAVDNFANSPDFDPPRQTITDWTDDFAEKSKTDISAFPADFEVPIYNVWKQQTKTAGVNHFGNSEVRWLDNLLYLYTNPATICGYSQGETGRPHLVQCAGHQNFSQPSAAGGRWPGSSFF